MAKQEVMDTVNRIIADILEIDPATLRPQDVLKGDLGVDSLVTIETVEALEEHYEQKIHFEEEDLDEIRTLGDVHYLVERKLKEAGL